MRGKKNDLEFFNIFISECVDKKKNSVDEIIDEAKKQISELDKKILEVNALKEKREKILGVLSSFQEQDKKSFNKNKKILHFYSIKNINICRYICDQIKKSNLEINNLKDSNNFELMFCIKKMLEYNILFRINDTLVKGSEFENYNRIVMKSR